MDDIPSLKGEWDIFILEPFMKGGGMMLGFADPQIFLVYILCIISAMGCLIYGILNWNKNQ